MNIQQPKAIQITKSRDVIRQLIILQIDNLQTWTIVERRNRPRKLIVVQLEKYQIGNIVKVW